MKVKKRREVHTISELAAAAASNFFLASIVDVVEWGAVVRLRGQYNNWFAESDHSFYHRFTRPVFLREIVRERNQTGSLTF